MKKVMALVLILLLLMFVVSCVSRQDYDAVLGKLSSVQNDLAAVQDQVQTLQSDLAAEQNRTAELEANLAAEQSKTAQLESDLAAEREKSAKLEVDFADEQDKVKKLTDDLSSLQRKADELSVLQGTVDTAQPYGELLEKYFFVPYYELTAVEIVLISVMVEETGDAELNEKWTAYLDSTTVKQAEERSVEFWNAVWDGMWNALFPSGVSS